jgi:hypothetical protein
VAGCCGHFNETSGSIAEEIMASKRVLSCAKTVLYVAENGLT